MKRPSKGTFARRGMLLACLLEATIVMLVLLATCQELSRGARQGKLELSKRLFAAYLLEGLANEEALLAPPGRRIDQLGSLMTDFERLGTRPPRSFGRLLVTCGPLGTEQGRHWSGRISDRGHTISLLPGQSRPGDSFEPVLP